MEERKYTVYMHICPNGKKYIGITSQKHPEKRWANGKGYIKNRYFYRAIQKYKWDNIKHEIIKINLSKFDACELEKELICKFKTRINEFGYNLSEGGETNKGFKRTEDSKNRQSISVSGRNNPMFGINVWSLYSDEEYKEKAKKISNANSGINNYWSTHKMTEESKLKMSQNHYVCNFENNPRSLKVYFNGIIYDCLKSCSTKNNINYHTFLGYLQGTNGMPNSFYDKGLYYIDTEIDIKYKEKRRISNKIKEVVCDEKIYSNVSMFLIAENIPKASSIRNYLNKKYPMPQKWKDRGLRYYNPETDSHLPIYVDTKDEV